MVKGISSPQIRKRYRVTAVATTLLVTFLVLFPKGGFKVAGYIPLTWGYLLIALPLPFLVSIRLYGFPLRASKRSLAAFGSLAPFQLLFVYSFVANGVANTGSTVSTFTSFFALPVAFLLVYPAFLGRVDGVLLARQLRFCIFGAAVFGIVLFVLYPFTGSLFEIPYLTVNADDYGLIEATKHISRGYFLKLISTYNNGNLYGVATLILLPLYDRLEPRAWRRNVLKLALVLTLSRTVWFGLIVEQMLSLVRVFAESALTFPRFLAGRAVKRAGVIVLTAGAILFGLVLSSGTLAFLFDRGLGGRVDLLTSTAPSTLLPSLGLTGLDEIIYASALRYYGTAGLFAIILIFVFPIFLYLSHQKVVRSPIRMAALKGLVIYMIVSCVDGAINLIPVMAFYWFVYMIFLEGWPGGLDLVPVAPVAVRPGEEVHA